MKDFLVLGGTTTGLASADSLDDRTWLARFADEFEEQVKGVMKLSCHEADEIDQPVLFMSPKLAEIIIRRIRSVVL